MNSVHLPGFTRRRRQVSRLTSGDGKIPRVASLYGVRVGLANASLSLLVYGSVVVVCRIAFARVPDRLPPLALGAAALGAIAAGLLLAAAWPSPPGLILGAAVAAVGVAFSTPAFFSAIFATAEPSQRGAASGTASAAIDIGRTDRLRPGRRPVRHPVGHRHRRSDRGGRRAMDPHPPAARHRVDTRNPLRHPRRNGHFRPPAAPQCLVPRWARGVCH